ncbi:MAG: DUF2278 family protein [Pseudonocardiaceae bacterium]
MPLSSYGVLIGRAVDSRREAATSDTPHYQIQVRDGAGVDYRIAVNVQSQLPPSDLLYLVDDDLRHPVISVLEGLGSGWHPLPAQAGGANLDFIRANLFDPAQMRPLPPDVPGADNDLSDHLDHYVQRAIKDPAAQLYLYGERWGPEEGTADKVFGFRPGNGVHDIHMNQGNSGRFREDDGVWQDGGILIHFPGEVRWVGLFLAFQSQAWHTDDTTGHALESTPPGPGTDLAAIRIIAALVNPAGPAPERETVLLINASPEPVDLSGWRIADQLKHTCEIPAGLLAAGATLDVQVSNGVSLGNRGGSITVLDDQGRKVSGVSYSATTAQREGWTVTF